VADPHHERPAELRFKSPGWNFYGGTVLLLWIVGVVLATFYWGLEALVLIEGPDYEIFGLNRQVGIVNQLWAVFMGAVGTFLAVGVTGLTIYGTAQTWRYWRQLRSPGAVVDHEGIRFEARRRPIMVPWSHIERLELNRSVFKAKVRTKIKTSTASRLRMRVSSDSALLRTGASPIPADRWLMVGSFESDVDVSYESAVDFLKRVASSRLEIIERTQWMGSGQPRR
jgi:hypothetical protein